MYNLREVALLGEGLVEANWDVTDTGALVISVQPQFKC